MQHPTSPKENISQSDCAEAHDRSERIGNGRMFGQRGLFASRTFPLFPTPRLFVGCFAGSLTFCPLLSHHPGSPPPLIDAHPSSTHSGSPPPPFRNSPPSNGVRSSPLPTSPRLPLSAISSHSGYRTIPPPNFIPRSSKPTLVSSSSFPFSTTPLENSTRPPPPPRVSKPSVPSSFPGRSALSPSPNLGGQVPNAIPKNVVSPVTQTRRRSRSMGSLSEYVRSLILSFLSFIYVPLRLP